MDRLHSNRYRHYCIMMSIFTRKSFELDIEWLNLRIKRVSLYHG